MSSSKEPSTYSNKKLNKTMKLIENIIYAKISDNLFHLKLIDMKLYNLCRCMNVRWIYKLLLLIKDIQNGR